VRTCQLHSFNIRLQRRSAEGRSAAHLDVLESAPKDSTVLVERYFPNASHQVVILSTDTEVDRHYYHLLQPAVARAYHLHYDEDSRATTGQEGYFWTD